MISHQELAELLKVKDGHLFRREGQELEFKEQFNLSGLSDYFRDFAAFANNRGGLIVFGIKDSPRQPQGLNPSSKSQFDKIDPGKISGLLLDIFSSEIVWDQGLFELEGKWYGVFKIFPSSTKPIIAKKDDGKSHQIKNGEIYYRYGGRTQKIQFAELQSIIDHRIQQNNNQWRSLVEKISRAGPQNAAILDTERGLIERDHSSVLVLDSDLATKIKFIKEGSFVEKKGATALKLIGDVMPIDKVAVTKLVKENLTKQYPLSARELLEKVKEALPSANANAVWQVVKDNSLKSNPDYSAYNFRNKRQEDSYFENGHVPTSIPSIYKHQAIDFIVKVLRSDNP